MKQKYVYLILFGLPGVLLSFALALLFGGVVGGVFWILIFGDNQWPNWTLPVIGVTAFTVFVASFVLSLILGYVFGSKRDSKQLPINKKHIAISLISTFALLLFLFLPSLGRRLNKPDVEVCQELCVQHGYDGRGSASTPTKQGERVCSCFDEKLQDWVDVGTNSKQ